MAYGKGFTNYFKVLNQFTVAGPPMLNWHESLYLTAQELAESTNPYVKLFFLEAGASAVVPTTNIVVANLASEPKPINHFLVDAVARPQIKINGRYVIDMLRDSIDGAELGPKMGSNLMDLTKEQVKACLAASLGNEAALIILDSWHQNFYTICHGFLLRYETAIGGLISSHHFNQPAFITTNFYCHDDKLMAQTVSYVIGARNTDLHVSMQEPFPLYGKVIANMQYDSVKKEFILLNYEFYGMHKKYLQHMAMVSASEKVAELWGLNQVGLPVSDYQILRLQAVEAFIVEIIKTESIGYEIPLHVSTKIMDFINTFYLSFKSDVAEIGLSMQEHIDYCYTIIAACKAERSEADKWHAQIISCYLQHVFISFIAMCENKDLVAINQELTARLSLLDHLNYLAKGNEDCHLFLRACLINYELSNEVQSGLTEFLNFGLLASSLTEITNESAHVRDMPELRKTQFNLSLKFDSMGSVKSTRFQQWYDWLTMAKCLFQGNPHAMLELLYSIVSKLAHYPIELMLIEQQSFVLGTILSAWQFPISALLSWSHYAEFHTLITNLVSALERRLVNFLKTRYEEGPTFEKVMTVFSIIREQLQERTLESIKTTYSPKGSGAGSSLASEEDLFLLFDPYYLLWLEIHILSPGIDLAEYKHIAELTLNHRMEATMFSPESIFYRGHNPTNFDESLKALSKIIDDRSKRSPSLLGTPTSRTLSSKIIYTPRAKLGPFMGHAYLMTAPKHKQIAPGPGISYG